MLRAWVSSPHAQMWWGDPDEELALIFDDADDFEPYIAYIDNQPIAYIQAWWPSKHPDLLWQHAMTSDTRGIDITIGYEANLGRGFGSSIVKAFANRLFAQGAKRLIIDPDITNTRAIAAYKKVGFIAYNTYTTGEGTDLLMELIPAEFKRTT